MGERPTIPRMTPTIKGRLRKKMKYVSKTYQLIRNDEKEMRLKRTNDGRLALADIQRRLGTDHPDYGRWLTEALQSIPPQPKRRA